MLWTDADFITTEDLLSVDPDVSETASSLGINLTGPKGMIRVGIVDAGRKLENALISFTTFISSNDLSANHLNAVFFTGVQPNQRRRITLDQIVVSGRSRSFDSDIKQWAMNRVLIRFYLAASNQSEDDRYTNRLEQFKKQDQLEYWPQLVQSGMPFVYRPMPAPGAVQYRSPGAWSTSQSILGGTTAAGQFTVGITYVDLSKYRGSDNPANAEGDAGVLQTLTLVSGNGIAIDITRLNPPTGIIPPSELARGFVVPLNASGWNVYVGAGDGTAPMYLQNDTPLPIATKTYALAGDPTTTGVELGIGQYVESLMATQNSIQRG